jgi:hypothetical protein
MTSLPYPPWQKHYSYTLYTDTGIKITTFCTPCCFPFSRSAGAYTKCLRIWYTVLKTHSMGTGGGIVRLASKSCIHIDQHGAAVCVISKPFKLSNLWFSIYRRIFSRSQFRISDPIFLSGTAYQVQMSIAVQRF